MGSVTSSPSGLAYLTQPGGLLSTLSPAISTSQLQSSSPQDIVSLSLAALQAQQTDGLFGVSSANSGIGGDSNEASLLSGIASAVTNSTPQEKADLSNQTVGYQEAQALFAPPTPAFNLIG